MPRWMEDGGRGPREEKQDKYSCSAACLEGSPVTCKLQPGEVSVITWACCTFLHYKHRFKWTERVMRRRGNSHCTALYTCCWETVETVDSWLSSNLLFFPLLTVKPNSAQKWWKLNHNLREKHMSGHNRAKKSALWDKSWLFISNFQLCVPYLLPFTQSSHSWRIIRTAVSGSCLLTSAQHSTQSNPRSWSGDLALLAWEQHPADRHLSINAQHLEPPRTMCSARSCSHCSPTTALPDIRGNSTVNYVDNTTTITIVRIRNNNESSWDGTNITENQSWWSHITTLA